MKMGKSLRNVVRNNTGHVMGAFVRWEVIHDVRDAVWEAVRDAVWEAVRDTVEEACFEDG